jgi:hypothetical protein
VWAIDAVALWLLAAVLPGVDIDSPSAAIATEAAVEPSAFHHGLAVMLARSILGVVGDPDRIVRRGHQDRAARGGSATARSDGEVAPRGRARGETAHRKRWDRRMDLRRMSRS